MRILIDLSYTQGEKDIVTGIHLHGKALVDYFLEQPQADVTISFLDGHKIDNKYLDEKVKKVYLKRKKNSKAYWYELSKIADEYDKVFLPYQVIEGKITCKSAELYMTVHDLTPLKEVSINKLNKYEALYKSGLKQSIKYIVKCVLRFTRIIYIKRKCNLKYNLKKSKLIFTDSEYSKNDLINTFKINSNKINVVYPFVPETKLDTISSKLCVQDYYLLVSAGRYLKNVHMALAALDELWTCGVETRQAIVLGNIPTKIINKLVNKDKVVSFGYVSYNDLQYLYKNAYCFIFPSLSEGFGLPPAEAMKYGTKVICSNAMSLKELYKGTILFDPYSVESIISAILKVPQLKSANMIKIYKSISDLQSQSAENTFKLINL